MDCREQPDAIEGLEHQRTYIRNEQGQKALFQQHFPSGKGEELSA